MRSHRVPRFANAMAASPLAPVLVSLLLVAAGCEGGEDAGDPGGPTNSETTDSSGDIAITVRAESSSAITVSWENPMARYSQAPESYHSTIYRNGTAVVSSTTAFSHLDTGLPPETTFCYRVEVIAVYPSFPIPIWYQTYGWSSGTACIATLPDRVAPIVTSTSPSDGTTDVALGATAITAIFGEDVDPLTVDASSFLVSGPSGAVPGTILVDGARVTFTASDGFAYASTYAVTITTAVTDRAGNHLADARSWSFSTASGPSTDGATEVTDGSATLHGTFENPPGDTTAVWFEYGTTTAHGGSTDVAYYATAGSVAFSAAVPGLSAWTTYHHRIVVRNSAGTYYGSDASFKTYMTPEVLSSGLNAPGDLQLDSGSLYWVEIYSDAVKTVPVGGGTTTAVASSAMGGNTASLALDGTNVYWADGDTIWKKDRNGGTVTVVASGLSSVYRLRVESSDLYFGSGNGIEKVDLLTGALGTAVSAIPTGGFAVDATSIYWSTGTSIHTTARAGGPIVALATGLSQAHGLLLEAGVLYWAEQTAIKKTNASGGTVTTIVAGVSALDLAKDDTHVYWTDPSGAINWAPLAGGAPGVLVTGQMGGSGVAPGPIAVDANGVYWIVGGSSYYPPLGEIRKAPKPY